MRKRHGVILRIRSGLISRLATEARSASQETREFVGKTIPRGAYAGYKFQVAARSEGGFFFLLSVNFMVADGQENCNLFIFLKIGKNDAHPIIYRETETIFEFSVQLMYTQFTMVGWIFKQFYFLPNFLLEFWLELFIAADKLRNITNGKH
ncbi:hypothetical protein A2671_02285 [Candidatus Kaiserbacteria bacterium RIFCSPHIGHO2_01_FULL_49_13]|uniref:Uncharacterized protein n=1 Tax=Candidatus Kaiserbacteria bacterium RIFCSPHIGHO2_01_FULL_49_13 TaxID=1798477 RepID=A0A1F6CEE5_9BACT|nr:MAG: hypothetical protein A2671_02285 [Candidatus Kaiserbacteria bacterium RIFCSPHIGHO2_01_FULL_49_13]